MKFRPFIEAREFVRTLGLNSSSDWLEYCKSKNKPEDIPSSPHIAYKNYWKGWGDWLGTGTVATQNRIYKTFEEARQFVHTSKLKNQHEDIQIFISYAKEDYDKALKLYNELKNVTNLNPWLDKESMLPGQKWRPTISEAIRRSRFFIALLSSNSINKKGYRQKELKEALDILEEYPESSVFIVPARLDDCNISDTRLQEIHYVDLFPNWDEGFKSILKTIQYYNK